MHGVQGWMNGVSQTRVEEKRRPELILWWERGADDKDRETRVGADGGLSTRAQSNEGAVHADWRGLPARVLDHLPQLV